MHFIIPTKKKSLERWPTQHFFFTLDTSSGFWHFHQQKKADTCESSTLYIEDSAFTDWLLGYVQHQKCLINRYNKYLMALKVPKCVCVYVYVYVYMCIILYLQFIYNILIQGSRLDEHEQKLEDSERGSVSRIKTDKNEDLQ